MENLLKMAESVLRIVDWEDALLFRSSDLLKLELTFALAGARCALQNVWLEIARELVMILGVSRYDFHN